MGWMKEVFEPGTREKAKGRRRVLLLDGHSSHYSWELLEFADGHNIMLLGYPPHCTHALQGLDVVCFAVMKREFEIEIRAFEEKHHRAVKKEDFAQVFGAAFLRAFSVATNKAAFSATGVVPFNPEVITAEQMAPSDNSSTRGTFPQLQTSPVRAVMAVYRYDPPTRLEADPDEMDPSIDPALYTPSKRKRALYASLASTRSGTYLVSDEKWQSSFPIPQPVFEQPMNVVEPDWSLISKKSSSQVDSKEDLITRNQQLEQALEAARHQSKAKDFVLESNTAQLVVQNMVLTKMKSALNEKEKEPQADRTILYPKGLGRVMTAPTFREEARRDDKRRRQKGVDAAECRVRRTEAQARRAELDRRWEAIGQEHELRVKEWEGECERLRIDGCLKKDLPKKPKKPRKPKISRGEGAGDLGAEGGDDVGIDEDVDGEMDLDLGGGEGGEAVDDDDFAPAGALWSNY